MTEKKLRYKEVIPTVCEPQQIVISVPLGMGILQSDIEDLLALMRNIYLCDFSVSLKTLQGKTLLVIEGR